MPPMRRHSRALMVIASLIAVPPAAAQLPATADSGAAAIALAGFQNRAAEQRTVEVELVASVGRLELRPGVTTDVYTYNGTVPGPLLEVREGDRVVVHFRNELPESTTVHWHGLHIPFEADGSPFHPVAPGETYEYSFTVRPGSAGTYWYHPHPHHVTGWQVAKGLYGAVIVRAPDDPLAGLPERVLILADNRFTEDGALDVPDRRSIPGRIDFENGREGDVLFINGRVRPELPIRSGEVQRWRIINASAARVYRLAIPGHTLLQVGTDGGLFERPVEVQEITLAAAERVELLVRGNGAPGTTAVLQSLPYDRYIPQTRPRDWDQPRDLLTLRYTAEPVAEPFAIPEVLRPVPVLDTLAATATHVVALSQGMINGRLMDMTRVDVQARLGATEIWQVENLVGMDHPFHLHGFQFQVIDRNGVPEPFRSWKDVVNVPKHETVRLIVRYDDYPGKWMFHCHILDHEDHGMMGVLQVD
ncbi:MAG: multicopper oxidase family protein [Gemmatimonadota bacterium]|nr:multicopper oxidase family protein [Gemmatimonadota bacterium]